jgi:hypothetical protein
VLFSAPAAKEEQGMENLFKSALRGFVACGDGSSIRGHNFITGNFD